MAFLLSQLCAAGILGVFQSPAARANDLTQQFFSPSISPVAPEATRARADQLLRLGGQLREAGQLLEAIASWRQAIEVYHQIGDITAIGLAYDYIGLTYGSLGRYQEAEDALRRRLAVARSNEDLRGQIYGLNNLGTILLQQGRIPQAQVLFQEGLAIAQSTRNQFGAGLSLSNLGLVAVAEGEFEQAVQLYQTSIDLRSRANDELGRANTLNNLGDVYRFTERPVAAIQVYNKAARLARRLGDRPTHLRAIDGLVAAYTSQGEFAQALTQLEARRSLTQGQ
ncbi:MAG: tetratricopeptide repeat protein, partial [Cyanothece sp. SIO1E1]|nr:tetratricopeptide repeat protein [Cyanothece sp. SIO1E1]